jgi:outer membrane protein assembly factor BamD (BamD/ComL family)
MRGFQSVLKIILLCAATSFCASVEAQTTAGLALKNLERHKWQRAHELLSKALAKDSLNVTAKYVLAQYFFSEGNPEYDIDSAYQYILQAENDFANLPLKQLEKLRRFPLDSGILVGTRKKIEESAFIRTQLQASENAWNYFIQNYERSSLLRQAVSLRDSVAYSNAAAENTYESFQNFLQKYPDAKQTLRAKENYERLLFENKTADQTLTSFETFLAEYPNTPYRLQIEQTIFEYATASGEQESYIAFIRSYPRNAFVKKANNILFHLSSTSDTAWQSSEEFLDDSLQNILQLEKSYLVPFYRNKKFGFMDSDGNEIVSAIADSLGEVYLCGNIDKDFIALADRVIGLNGSVILNEKANDIDDIGFGFLFVESGGCAKVIHKSGFRIGEGCITDAKILNGKFVALKHKNRWSIWTMAGRRLREKIDDVIAFKDVICIKNNDRVRLLTAAKLAKLPSPPDNGGIHEYDAAAYWNSELILVRNGTQVGLLDQSLGTLVPLAAHRLNPYFSGVVASDTTGTCVYNFSGKKSEILQQVVTRAPWLATKDSLWSLIDPLTMHPFTVGYDTIVFSGSFAIGIKKDSSVIFFNRHRFQRFRGPLNIEFVAGKDSLSFLTIEVDGRKTIYNHLGQKLFSAAYDQIQYAGANLFIVTKRDKKGLVSQKGTIILAPAYDAIGTVQEGKVSLLKSMKFGLFDCMNKKLISPSYEKNLSPYNSRTIAAYKDGLYGFIDWNNKPLSKFEFNEIQYWNDTTALVKKNSQWMLYEIRNRTILAGEIKDVRFIRNKPGDKLAIIYQGTNHGVIHSQEGTIIPVSFTDIVNVGSDEKPMYFTEKHVQEAAIFVVIYYNHFGHMLRKEVYDQEDYDKIFCHEK